MVLGLIGLDCIGRRVATLRRPWQASSVALPRFYDVLDRLENLDVGPAAADIAVEVAATLLSGWLGIRLQERLRLRRCRPRRLGTSHERFVPVRRSRSRTNSSRVSSARTSPRHGWPLIWKATGIVDPVCKASAMSIPPVGAYGLAQRSAQKHPCQVRLVRH